MGLIKMAVGSLASTVADQVLEYFYCDSLPNEVLMRKGAIKRNTTKYSSTNNASDNIISNGSVIAVNAGQFMMIVEDGKVVDFTDEEGRYTYDKSSEPSLFYGGFGKGILNSFKTMGKRFKFGGETAKDQRVYFINKKLITDNKFGSQSPIDYRDMEFNLSIRIACRGTYVYRVVDPIIFYTNLCANVAYEYKVDEIRPQFKSDLMASLAPALQKCALQKIPYDMLMASGEAVTSAIKESLYNEWELKAGINVDRISLEAVTPIDDENFKRLQQFQAARVYTNSDMASAAKTGAQVAWIQGMGEGAAKGGSSSGSAIEGAMGMMAMGMMNNMMGGSNDQGAAVQVNDTSKPKDAWKCDCGAENLTSKFCPVCGKERQTDVWKCSCGKENSGKFCGECGAMKPEAKKADSSSEWVCSCGHKNEGRFCPVCGAKKPVVKKYICDKCGWKPEDEAAPPKFCPECGDRFTDDDLVD